MRKTKIRTGLLFLAPILAGTALFFAIPFGMVIARSFGLPNSFDTSHYAAVLNSEAFRLAAGNTAAFLLLGVPTVLACALGIALLEQRFHKIFAERFVVGFKCQCRPADRG